MTHMVIDWVEKKRHAIISISPAASVLFPNYSASVASWCCSHSIAEPTEQHFLGPELIAHAAAQRRDVTVSARVQRDNREKTPYPFGSC